VTTNVKLFLGAGLLVALALAVFVSPFADRSPDGLEKVAGDEGFLEAADDHDLADSPVADYAVEGVDDERLSTGASGLIGVLLTFAVGLAVFGLIRRQRGRGGDGRDDRPRAVTS
jgi:PDGLE domain